MITVGIASVPARRDMLLETLKSLVGQCDQIFVALNGYSEIPQEITNPKIHCEILDNSLKDSAKFLHVEECDGWYLGADDDLVYSPNYCNYMISKAQQYNALVSLHGRRYNRPIRAFRKHFTLNYHCLHSYTDDERLDVCGSGVCCFNTNRLKLSISDFKIPGMADIWLSKQAWEQGVPIMGVAHKNTFVRYMPPPDPTLWMLSKDDSVHTRILQSFLK